MPRDLLGSLLTEVSRAGFGFRHLAHSRSGRPLLGAPAQPAAVLRSTRSEHTGSSPVGGASRGYSTAARALVGKSYAPSAPHASQGTSQQEAAEGLRLAVVEQLLPGTDREGRGGEGIDPVAKLSYGRGARGLKARAQSALTHAPRRAVPDSHASRA
jgi:hypothetical protein